MGRKTSLDRVEAIEKHKESTLKYIRVLGSSLLLLLSLTQLNEGLKKGTLNTMMSIPCFEPLEGENVYPSRIYNWLARLLVDALWLVLESRTRTTN